MSSHKSTQKLFDFVVDHPWKTIFLCLLGIVFIGSYMRFVAPSVSYQDLLGAHHPKLIDYETIQSEYTRDDNLLVLVEAKEGSVFTQPILSGMRELTQALWKTPYSIRVDSLTNFQHSEAAEDDLLVGDLVSANNPLGKAELERIQTIALAEPLLLNRAINENGDVTGVSVSFAFPNVDASEKLEAVKFVEETVAKFQNSIPGIQIYIGGLIALDATVMKIAEKEAGMFLGLVMLIVVVLVAFLLRSVLPLMASILVFVFSIVAGVAFSGMMGWKLTPITASVPMIILILAVADCVHLITSFQQHLSKGNSKVEAIREALKLNFQPIALTSITSAIGFLTLNFSESDSIGALGNQVAFGIMVAFVLSVTLLPALLRVLPIKTGERRVAFLSGSYGGYAAFLAKYKAFVLLASGMLVLILGYFIQHNEFNDEVPKYFAKSLSWRQANDFAEDQFGGAYTFTYSFDSGIPDGVTNPEFLKKAESFVNWLRSQPEIVYVNAATDTFKRLNRNMHGDDPKWYKLPDNQQLAAQYLLLYEMSLPYGLDLNDQINLTKSALRVQAVSKTLSTTEVLQMEQRMDRWLASNTSGVNSLGSGVQLMFAHMMSKDVKSMVLGAFLGLVVISLLLIVAFRSLRVGLISTLPNLLPAITAFGIWGILVGQIGMGLAMVSGMTIGIVVDDTVHFLSKYLKARREQFLDAHEAVKYALNTVGPSLVLTTFVLVVGFMMITLLSEFRVNSDMGKMTSIVLVLALILDLVMLPTLLMIFDKKQVSPKIQMNPQLQNA